MKTFLLLILTGLFVVNVNAQISFSSIDSKLKTIKDNNLSELICSSSTISIKFQLKREVTVLPQNNLVTVDSQTIQISALEFNGYTKNTNGENINNQKELLDTYSKYELEYFKNDLGIEVINPGGQWVMTKSKGWYIWYFRVGKIPTEVDKQTETQLFATTVIGNKILIINAPILAGDDFTKAALIVNEMMETLIIIKQ